jgi:hypothetical protein
MKKVAATSGQSVSFAVLFLLEEIAPAGNWAGRDKVLNFLSRPPSAILALSAQVVSLERVRKEKNTANFSRCKKNMHLSAYFFSGVSEPPGGQKLKNSRQTHSMRKIPSRFVRAEKRNAG